MSQNQLKPTIIVSDALVSFCPCGALIPYGNQCCPGHGRIREPYINRTCYNCKGVTYSYKGKAQWRRDDKDNLICKRCYDGLWRNKNPDYNKVWHINNPDYSKVSYLLNREDKLMYSKAWYALNGPKAKREEWDRQVNQIMDYAAGTLKKTRK